MFRLIAILSCFVLAVVPSVFGSDAANSNSTNYLRIALPGKEDSHPSLSKRYSFRTDGEYLSVYDKGPIYPGAGKREQYFFISEDYTVYDGSRSRIIPFFDPEEWMNCDCDTPIPTELDVPHRFAVYHPVTVQAPLPNVPFNLYAVKYSGYYYACPTHVNPYEYAWYRSSVAVSPCKWIWYQSVADATSNTRY